MQVTNVSRKREWSLGLGGFETLSLYTSIPRSDSFRDSPQLDRILVVSLDFVRQGEPEGPNTS